MKRIFFISVLFSYGSSVISQGCSDAGLCTIKSFKPSGDFEQSGNPKNQFRVGISGGSADYDITVFGAVLEYSRHINNALSIDTKIGLISQTGNDINTAGFSDIFLNLNYKATKQLHLVLGTKVPLSNADRQKNGLPLPMDYQSSLGTFDLLAGVGYNYKKWKFNLGWQQPLGQNNNNFLAENYPVSSPLRKFQSTNNYVRKGDLLLRVSYPIQLTSKLIFTPGLLPICHLGDDEFTNLNGKQIIHGSKGLTVNVNAFLNYQITKLSAIEFSVGSPLIVRDVRPDGLTRSFVSSVQYQLSF